ncbi:hypothetical protein PR001_g13533 [Phytophthora rubi]|uniref:BZIP domain-containing protein n=2 Tax=Phytophthora rubi TaxID=129364 RepID=A0A6A3LN76_9STRA|nr:hypothetical protein PR001_g13533 [Phytophthora rubi]
MSFLESPGEPEMLAEALAEMLAEALAFVDGFDFSGDGNMTDGSSVGSNSGGESHKRRRSGGKDEDADVAPLDKHDMAKSRRKNAMYSARLRAKKKNEMNQLKEQVTQLQMQLDRLKSAKGSCSTVATGNGRLLALENYGRGASYWLQEATTQAYRRNQAEQLNAQLKTLLDKVVKRSKTMHDAFQNLQSLGCEINLAVGASSTILTGTSLRSNDATPQLGELREFLDQMYTSAQDVLSTGSAESAASTSQIKCDPVTGRRCVQLTSSTPLARDLDTAGRMIWRGMQLKGSKSCKYYVHRLHVNASAIAKSFYLSLSDISTPITLHGAAFARKFEERDRILYIWTTAIVPPQQESGNIDSVGKSWELRVREKGWAMLSRSPSNPEHHSVFRTCFEVSSELGDFGRNAGPTSLTQTDCDRIGSSVVMLLSSDLHKFHERIQDELMAESAAVR